MGRKSADLSFSYFSPSFGLLKDVTAVARSWPGFIVSCIVTYNIFHFNFSGVFNCIQEPFAENLPGRQHPSIHLLPWAGGVARAYPSFAMHLTLEFHRQDRGVGGVDDLYYSLPPTCCGFAFGGLLMPAIFLYNKLTVRNKTLSEKKLKQSTEVV